jgi:hypothetical protein
MNNLTKREVPDRSKINPDDPVQAKSWSRELANHKAKASEADRKGWQLSSSRQKGARNTRKKRCHIPPTSRSEYAPANYRIKQADPQAEMMGFANFKNLSA